jgi:hypothetical protein
MANELGIYQLLRNILSKSTVIEGRFAILHGVAADINTTDFGQQVKDVLDGLKVSKKYPAVVMSPPYETQNVDDRGWTTYRFDMFFLTLSQRTGDGEIKNRDIETNLSNHTKEQDWKDMREVAGNFVKKLREITRVPPVCSILREVYGSRNEYKRLTVKANDNLNGIFLSFDMQVAEDYCTFTDYAEDAVIEIPEDFSPHPLHKH